MSILQGSWETHIFTPVYPKPLMWISKKFCTIDCIEQILKYVKSILIGQALKPRVFSTFYSVVSQARIYTELEWNAGETCTVAQTRQSEPTMNLVVSRLKIPLRGSFSKNLTVQDVNDYPLRARTHDAVHLWYPQSTYQSTPIYSRTWRVDVLLKLIFKRSTDGSASVKQSVIASTVVTII